MGDAKRRRLLGIEKPEYMNSELYITIFGILRQYLNNELSTQLVRDFILGQNNLLLVEYLDNESKINPILGNRDFLQFPSHCLPMKNKERILQNSHKIFMRSSETEFKDFRFYGQDLKLIAKLNFYSQHYSLDCLGKYYL